MYNRDGIGLAAPQIGVMRRLIIADIGVGLLSLINPEILERRGEASLLEGCLSLPSVGVKVTRNESIIVRGIDPAGREVIRDMSGLMARVIQHEIDHLNGVLILDYGPVENLREQEKLPQVLQYDRKTRLQKKSTRKGKNL
jgi:peptide deformylase